MALELHRAMSGMPRNDLILVIFCVLVRSDRNTRSVSSSTPTFLSMLVTFSPVSPAIDSKLVGFWLPSIVASRVGALCALCWFQTRSLNVCNSFSSSVSVSKTLLVPSLSIDQRLGLDVMLMHWAQISAKPIMTRWTVDSRSESRLPEFSIRL
jgi:hypothetical protein